MEYGRMRWVGLVTCLGEKYRQSCFGETGTRMHVLGRRTTKCEIILKCKKYKMRAWTGLCGIRQGGLRRFFLHYNENCGCTRNQRNLFSS